MYSRGGKVNKVNELKAENIEMKTEIENIKAILGMNKQIVKNK